MAEAKKIHLELTFPAERAELFRTFVANLRLDGEGRPTTPFGVEILYEESGTTNLGNACVEFSLWFDKPATAYWFALYLDEAKAAWALLEQEAKARASYPRFLYVPKLRTWLRYNSAEYFCLVSESQLQVRRERPQELFLPEEVEVITEAGFLEQYQRIRTLLRERAEHYYATYQRRGEEGNEWFYCNYIYASGDFQLLPHLRLNVSSDEHGRSWQLLYAHDTRQYDPRRVASSKEEFSQQLAQLLAEADAAATGQQGGGVRNG